MVATQNLRTRWYRLTMHPVARFLSSPRLAVVGLGYLFALVLAGTLYQAGHGVYDAQTRFFGAWVSWAGPLPFPGAQPALWLLGLNLAASLVFRIRWIRTNAGLVIAHLGLILLLLGGLRSSLGARSTVLGLVEGQATRVSHDPNHWELHLATPERLVTIPWERLRSGQMIESPIAGLPLQVMGTMAAARPLLDMQGEVVGLAPLPPAPDPGANVAGIELRLGRPESGRILPLYGGDTRPHRVVASDRVFDVWLGRKAYPLPAPVRLLRFEAEFHPGTQLPRMFRSTLQIGDGASGRTAVITMNHPLTVGGHTLYQTSWGRDAEGRLISVFEVVRNPARVIPYVSSLVILVGLLAHMVLRRGGAA